MVTLHAHLARERAAEVAALLEGSKHVREVVLRHPAELAPRALVDVDAIEARRQLPAARGVDRAAAREQPLDRGRRVAAELGQVRARERRGGRHDVAAEAERPRTFERAQVRGRHVLDVRAPVQELVRLRVERIERGAALRIVVALGEEARGAEHHDRQPVAPVVQLAKVLRGDLGRAVHVLRDRRDVLGDPGRGLAGDGRERGPERARRAREHERVDARRDGGLEQGQRAAHVDVDELLRRVRDEVRLVQRGGMDDGVRTAHGVAHERAVGDAADAVGPGRRARVETDRLAPVRAQRAHQRFAEVARAAGHEDGHANRFQEKARSLARAVAGGHGRAAMNDAGRHGVFVPGTQPAGLHRGAALGDDAARGGEDAACGPGFHACVGRSRSVSRAAPAHRARPAVPASGP